MKRSRPVLLILAAGVAALALPWLFYVWGGTQIVTLGYRIESARRRLAELEDDYRALKLERARLVGLERIEARALRLGLKPAAPERVLVVAPAAD